MLLKPFATSEMDLNEPVISFPANSNTPPRVFTAVVRNPLFLRDWSMLKRKSPMFPVKERRDLLAGNITARPFLAAPTAAVRICLPMSRTANKPLKVLRMFLAVSPPILNFSVKSLILVVRS